MQRHVLPTNMQDKKGDIKLKKLFVVLMVLVLLSASAMAVYASPFSGQRELGVERDLGDTPDVLSYSELFSFRLSDRISLNSQFVVLFPEFNLKNYNIQPLDLNVVYALNKFDVVFGATYSAFEVDRELKTLYLKAVQSW